MAQRTLRAKRNCGLDITPVVAEHLCHSCGACEASCNHGAIGFEETPGGHIFPVIDYRHCTDCGLCYEVCPGLQFQPNLIEGLPADPFVGSMLSSHVGRAADQRIFMNAQSGGVATAIIKHLFDTGMITGAVLATMHAGTPPRGDPVLVRSADELEAHQKSKYIPIPLLTALKRPKSLPDSLALVGLSCHLHGILNLINLYPILARKIVVKLGLVCAGVQAVSVIDFLGEELRNEAIQQFAFRDKRPLGYPGNPVFTTTTGRQLVLKQSKRTSVKDFFTPARCRLCFDKMNVFSDLTLGDPHGIPNIDRQLGESLIITRTETGARIVDTCQRAGAITIRPVSSEQAVAGQGIQQKRESWKAYMQAWKELGRTPPAFSIPFEGVAAQQHHYDNLLHAVKLDLFPSRMVLVRAVHNWLRQQWLRKRFVRLLRISTSVKKYLRRRQVC